MSDPRSIRFERNTTTRLAAYAARRPGLSSSGAAALLVEEGLRMDEHPGVLFRPGPAGRRARLVAGPDVWEVIRALKDIRETEPNSSMTQRLDLVSETAGIPASSVRVAVTYYSAFPQEIDEIIADAVLIETELERQFEVTRELLGT